MTDAIQTNYPEKLDQGRPGGIVNTELCNKISRNVETAAGIGFGVPVERGTDDKGVVIFAGGAPLGITILERGTDANTPDVYAQYSSAAIMTQGPIFAMASVQVAAGDQVYVVDADATFHNAAATGRTLYPNAVWDQSTTGADQLSVIALKNR